MGCTLMERPASSSSEGKVLEGPGRRAGRHTSMQRTIIVLEGDHLVSAWQAPPGKGVSVFSSKAVTLIVGLQGVGDR